MPFSFQCSLAQDSKAARSGTNKLHLKKSLSV